MNKEKRNLILGFIAVAVVVAITFLVVVRYAGATGGWELTNTEYGECVANDSEDCENYGGTRTVTKTYSKTEYQCVKWFIICLKWEEVTLEKTEVSTEECEVEPPVCQEEPPVEEPEVKCTGNCGTPPTFAGSSTDAPGVCSAPLPPTPSNALVWRHGDSATVQWVPSHGVDKAIIYWKENTQSNWQHSMVVGNSGYETVGALSDMDITFGVSQYNGCSQSEIVVIVDGSGEGIMFIPQP